MRVPVWPSSAEPLPPRPNVVKRASTPIGRDERGHTSHSRGRTEPRTFRTNTPLHQGLPVAEWKWSVAAFPDDLDEIDASWFIVVVDTCPAGGGFEYVAGDFSTDFRKRIVLKGDDIQGRCLEMRLTVLRAPPTGVPVWMTDFYRGND